MMRELSENIYRLDDAQQTMSARTPAQTIIEEEFRRVEAQRAREFAERLRQMQNEALARARAIPRITAPPPQPSASMLARMRAQAASIANQTAAQARMMAAQTRAYAAQARIMAAVGIAAVGTGISNASGYILSAARTALTGTAAQLSAAVAAGVAVGCEGLFVQYANALTDLENQCNAYASCSDAIRRNVPGPICGGRTLAQISNDQIAAQTTARTMARNFNVCTALFRDRIAEINIDAIRCNN